MENEIKYAEWDLKNDNVIVLAGSTGQDQALKYNVYLCQNLRNFRAAKYLTFYKDSIIDNLFEIIDGPYDYGTVENTPEYKKMVENKFIEDFGHCRVFKLKHVGNVGPIKNDSLSKAGKPVPFTYGQPRYTTFDRIQNATITSELINGIAEVPVVLDEVGSNTLINPNNATIALSWKSKDDFDIAVAYADKQGKTGLVYFVEKGSLTSYPFMQLDKDSRGSIIFKQRETILINNLNEMQKVYILCWDYEAIREEKPANFNKKNSVEVAVEDENGFSSVAVLMSDGTFNTTCIAKIENKDGFVFTNISRGLNVNFNAKDIIELIEK